jgi:hypothetical protein
MSHLIKYTGHLRRKVLIQTMLGMQGLEIQVPYPRVRKQIRMTVVVITMGTALIYMLGLLEAVNELPELKIENAYKHVHHFCHVF